MAKNKGKKSIDGRPRVGPTRYPGSKWGLWEWIREYMAFPHEGFVDLFGGGGSVTISKPPVKLRVFNDLDGDAVNFFKQARDNLSELAWLLTMTPYSREEYQTARVRCDDDTPLERARKWFCSQWMSTGQTPFSRQGFRHHPLPGSAYSPGEVSYVEAKMAMSQVAERFQGVVIENMDALECISHYEYDTVLIYADPPYLRTTGRNVDYHVDAPKDKSEDKEWHRSLFTALNNARGYKIVAGTESPEYAQWYEGAGWQRVEKKASRGGVRKKSEDMYVECMWLCPHVQRALAMDRQPSLPLLNFIQNKQYETEAE